MFNQTKYGVPVFPGKQQTAFNQINRRNVSNNFKPDTTAGNQKQYYNSRISHS